jgi:hypothetical protein
MMKVLNIVRSTPDDSVQRLIDAFCVGSEDKMVALYESDVDWFALVDEIFDYDRIICWW